MKLSLYQRQKIKRTIIPVIIIILLSVTVFCIFFILKNKKTDKKISLSSSSLSSLSDSIENNLNNNINNSPDIQNISIPESAVEYNNHLYQIYDNAGSWEEAQNYCESLGGHLAIINNKPENDFIYRYINSMGYKTTYFGLKDISSDNNWQWVEGSYSEYTNWSEGEPNSPEENYAIFSMSSRDGKWNDVKWGINTTSFICEWEQCDENKNRIVWGGSHAYLGLSEGLSCIEAEKKCNEMGGHLISINYEEEQEIALDIAKRTGKDNIWIGGYYSEGNWYWSDGSPFEYSNWDSYEIWDEKQNAYVTFTQPDNYGGNEEFIRFVSRKIDYSDWYANEGKWNDTANEGDSDAPLESFGFICEWNYESILPEKINISAPVSETVILPEESSEAVPETVPETETETESQIEAVVITKEDDLNVRSGPSTDFEKIGTVAKNSVVIIVEAAGNGWYKIKFGDGYGYVSGDYIKIK